MSFQVTARKWRPQSFKELVGQDHISLSLSHIIQSQKIPHAFLFSGPRGVGKTSMARILAKSLVCELGISIDPCQKCSNCVEVSLGFSFDVLEIDAASNRGIDEIRQIKDNVKYHSTKTRFKIFIIDEVHMLTDAAFNALLKTLEEPPEHVIFILATTEVYKIKMTIRSRCQHYNFRPLSMILIQKQLEQLCESEGREYDEQALFYIAKMADGSMRDGQSLFDQVMVYAEGPIELGDVEKLFGPLSSVLYFQFLDGLVRKDIPSLLSLVESLILNGEDISHFIVQLTEHFRYLLILKVCGRKEVKFFEVTENWVEDLAKYVRFFKGNQIIQIIQLLIGLYEEIKRGSRVHYLLDSLIFRIINYDEWVSMEELLKKIDLLEKEIRNHDPNIRIEEKTKIEEKTRIEEKTKIEEKTRIEEKIKIEEKTGTAEKTEEKTEEKTGIEEERKTDRLVSKEEDFGRDWRDELERNGSMILASCLKKAEEIKLSGDTILVNLSDRYAHEELTKSENMKELEGYGQKILGRKVEVIIRVRELEGMGLVGGGNLDQDSVLIDEVIERVKDMFDGEVVDRRDG